MLNFVMGLTWAKLAVLFHTDHIIITISHNEEITFGSMQKN